MRTSNPTAPLHYCTTAPLHHFITAPLHYCTTFLSLYFNSLRNDELCLSIRANSLLSDSLTATGMSLCSDCSECATTPLHYCTTALLHHCTTALLSCPCTSIVCVTTSCVCLYAPIAYSPTHSLPLVCHCVATAVSAPLDQFLSETHFGF